MGFVTNDPNNWWGNGIIPFEIDASITVGDQPTLVEAIRRWNEAAPIQLVPRQGQANYLEFITGQAGSGGHADGGPNSGRATISMDFRWRDNGNENVVVRALMHEIGHIAGLIHEHQRPDRDTYITLNDPDPNNGNTVVRHDGRTVGPYDCVSIMHYVPVGVLTDPMTKPGGCQNFGQRDDPSLSTGDLAALRLLSPPLLHTIRFRDSWQPWGDVLASIEGNPGDIVEFNCAGIGGELHLCARASDGRLWHTIRFADRWQPWGDVLYAVQGDPGSIVEIDCASVGGQLHLCARANDGRLWHTIRFRDSWQPWGDVLASIEGNPGDIVEFNCAGIGGELHLCARASDGRVWHTIRFADRWQPWGDVLASIEGNPGNIVELDFADVGGQLQLCARKR